MIHALTLLIQALYSGVTLVCIEKIETAIEVVKIIKVHKITAFYVVPGLFSLLADITDDELDTMEQEICHAEDRNLENKPEENEGTMKIWCAASILDPAEVDAALEIIGCDASCLHFFHGSYLIGPVTHVTLQSISPDITTPSG